MTAYTYKNTKTNIPHWETTTHLTQVYGYGYETDTHFVHFYGKEAFYIISIGLTVIEEKIGNYFDWLENRFGASEIQQMDMEVGHTIEGVWRPSLYYWDDTEIGIGINPFERRSEEQSLRILVEKLDEILLFIEPSIEGLKAYSHKTRELLILACTEVENQWRALLTKAGHSPLNGKMYTTQDYVKLLSKTFIDEFQVGLRNYNTFKPSKPFQGWDEKKPSKSLLWYNAYNKTKHDREQYFSSAQLQVAIDAVAANIILYCSRFSPLLLINDTNTLSSLIKQIFDIQMIDANRKSFYLPRLEFEPNTRKDCFVYDCYRAGHKKDWILNT